MTDLTGVEVRAPQDEPRQDEILTPEALAFVADLQRISAHAATSCSPRRAERRRRSARPARSTSSPRPRRSATATGRSPRRRSALQDRRVEITGPTDAKMAINALNSGAKVWLADLEDANTPHWAQRDRGPGHPCTTRTGTSSSSPSRRARQYALNDGPTSPSRSSGRAAGTCDEKHVLVDGSPMVGALLDFGLHFFHNAAELLARGQRPVLLPAEDGEPPRGAALERRLHPRAGGARHPARHASAPPC